MSFTVYALHNLPPPAEETFLAEMKRVMRLGGVVVADKHNPSHPVSPQPGESR
jgi:hypothetical protein